MVDENVFEETILEELPREIAKMTAEQMELEKARIQARIELERNRMELEKARIEQETRLREIDLARRGHGGSHDSFEVSKQATQRWRILCTFWAYGTQPRMAKRMLVNATPDCTDGKSPEGICTSPNGKLRRLWIGEIAILKSFKLVPEAYRQRFKMQRKKENQSYVEFLRDKENALEKWCE